MLLNGKCAPRILHTSFYAFYQEYYAPRLQAIDLLLKTMEKPLTITETAEALGLSMEAVAWEMACASVRMLDRNGFLTVMRNGGSTICRLYQRELARGNKAMYSPSDIAFIYGLTESNVVAVCKELGVNNLHARDIPWLLEHIAVFILY